MGGSTGRALIGIQTSGGPHRVTLRTQLLVALGALAALPVVLLGIAQARAASATAAELADRETRLASTSLAREIGYLIETQASVTRTFASEVGAAGALDDDRSGWRGDQYIRAFPGLYGAMILPFNGDAKTGIRLAENLAARQPYLDIVSALHAYALACAGQVEEARGILEQLEWLSRERFVMRSFTPAVYVALGDFDAAISELHTSADARCPWFFQMLADPRHKPLHNRQEFKELRAILTRIEATAASA